MELRKARAETRSMKFWKIDGTQKSSTVNKKHQNSEEFCDVQKSHRSIEKRMRLEKTFAETQKNLPLRITRWNFEKNRRRWKHLAGAQEKFDDAHNKFMEPRKNRWLTELFGGL